MDDLGAFFHAVGAAPNPGVTAEELDAFEAHMGLSLPPQVRAFYRATNGLTIDGDGPGYRESGELARRVRERPWPKRGELARRVRHVGRQLGQRPAAWMEILPLAEVVPYLEGEVMPFVDGVSHYGIPEVWGYFPFTDCNDSNPYCVCCNGPLRGRVVHVFHDDDPKLKLGLGSVPGRRGGRRGEQGGGPPRAG
jgi:hypothetical protein